MDLANVAERVAIELRNAIESGLLAPGEKLVERQLAERLGVSHIPVREAIARLAEEGLVTRRPRRVAVVTELTPDDLDEISSLRIVLESFVARRVQARWSEEMETTLRDIVSQMSDAAAREDVTALFELDRNFHQALWVMADHRELMAITSQLRRRMDSFMRAANNALATTEMHAHAHAHALIVDALATRDPAQSDEVVAEHILGAVERVTPLTSAAGPNHDGSVNRS